MTVGSAILLARLSPRGAALARAALLGRTSAAPLSTSASVRDAAKGSSAEGYIHPVYFKVKETQKYYQQDNGLRIHQRHGARGTILWYITLAMVAAGFVQFFMFISKAMFPPKND